MLQYLAKPRKALQPIKMTSPYIEKLLMPPHWRAYREELQRWRKKCLKIIKPFVILPKIVKTDKKYKINEEEKEKVPINFQNDISDSTDQTEDDLDDDTIKNINQDISQYNEINLQEFSSVDTRYKQDSNLFPVERNVSYTYNINKYINN
jgi:hypothetical protein